MRRWTGYGGGVILAAAGLVGAVWLGAAEGAAAGTVTAQAQAPASSSCGEMKAVRVQEWTGDIINIVPWVADAKGLFRKACVAATLVPLVAGPGAITALVNGTIEFSNQAPDGVMRSRARGVNVRLVGNMYAGHWNALVAGKSLALAGQGYPAMMKGLVGKKIGVTVLGGTTEAFSRSAFEGAGLDSFAATYVAVGGVTTAVPALKQGSVDAAMMFGTGPELAEALGVGQVLLDYRKRGVGPRAVQAMWGATLSWVAYGPYIDKNPETVAAFVRASNEAIAWILDSRNREELYRIIGERMPLPEAVPDRSQTSKKIVDVNASVVGAGIPREAIEGWNQYLIHLKQIQAAVPYDELVWTTGRP
jgi:ABC-type nitrate/sulfonate/bicarbonate transport system substrate-binding protein